MPDKTVTRVELLALLGRLAADNGLALVDGREQGEVGTDDVRLVRWRRGRRGHATCDYAILTWTCPDDGIPVRSVLTLAEHEIKKLLRGKRRKVAA